LDAPVQRAVGAALAINRDAGFDVVGSIPATGDAPAQQQALARLTPDLRAVAGAIADAGVPSSRIVVSARAEPGAGAQEVRVFLR
jgi:hypothetical protein